MYRYFLEIAFRGTQYNGWQIQPGQPTVQQEVESALSVLLGTQTQCVGCGRTDTGVHASQFFLHFDADHELDVDRFVYRLNGIFGFEIAANRLMAVAPDAHTRFDAVRRTYRYYIHFRKNPFLNDRSTFVAGNVDVDLMNQAAAILPETDNFKSFAKVHSDVNNHLCRVDRAVWTATEHGLMFEICANRFLRNMVRSIVGTTLEVGQKKISMDDFTQIIAAQNRNKAGKSVDARGLFLHQIEYPYI